MRSKEIMNIDSPEPTRGDVLELMQKGFSYMEERFDQLNAKFDMFDARYRARERFRKMMAKKIA